MTNYFPNEKINLNVREEIKSKVLFEFKKPKYNFYYVFATSFAVVAIIIVNIVSQNNQPKYQSLEYYEKETIKIEEEITNDVDIEEAINYQMGGELN